MNIIKDMITRKIYYLTLFVMLAPSLLHAQGEGESIQREVKLYNPFKPTLSKETKLGFLPDMSDTSAISPVFEYTISPNPFVPHYELKEIGAARLEPDPLPKLYKSFLNVGFGNYFSPVAELSISSDRSRNSLMGFYASHNSSFGKIKIDNDEVVYGGYMDNMAKAFATRFFRRSAVTGNIDFNHSRRYAYGYDPGAGILPEPGHDSLKVDYMSPSASVSYYSTRLDSNHLDYDVKLLYDLLFQSSGYYQHHAGIAISAGYNMKLFYAKARASYEYYSYAPAIDFRPRHLVSFDPSINRSSKEWSFRVGVKTVTDSRNKFDPADIIPPEYKTRLYFYPDVRFQFTVIPSFVSLFVSLDGEYQNNQPSEMIAYNPFILSEVAPGLIAPSRELYQLKPTDHKLRVGGGILGSAGEFSTYKLLASYSLVENMLFFTGDPVSGRTLTPLYDNGELLKIHGEFRARINDQMNIGGNATYYNYQLENEEYPWHKPAWEGKLEYSYNLRNKILATASVNLVSKRYATYGPMAYSSLTEPSINELPMHGSLNMGLEYRYTKILSFWTRLNNISTSRYYEWNFYPSQRFLFMAGFTYSL